MSPQCSQYKYTFEEQKKRFPYGTDRCKNLKEIRDCICTFCKSDNYTLHCPKKYLDNN